MKYVIFEFLKKAVAVLTSAFMTMTGGIFAEKEPEQPERPEANSVTAYSEEDADYSLTVEVEDEIHDISDLLFGIFFEDINFAADGGLYAEMTVNRSFEFTDLAVNDALYGWNNVGGATLEVKKNEADCLNANNPNSGIFTDNRYNYGMIEEVPAGTTVVVENLILEDVVDGDGVNGIYISTGYADGTGRGGRDRDEACLGAGHHVARVCAGWCDGRGAGEGGVWRGRGHPGRRRSAERRHGADAPRRLPHGRPARHPRCGGDHPPRRRDRHGGRAGDGCDGGRWQQRTAS